ncbi:EAL domain-containing protein [Lachnoclostridium sp. Marseille-P6806]|uniref:EAL domain-containing protein n=1 Tax=Lachnoclostridium sp. Marseille-P6806 TaxID=2364793 RepID=UPI00103082FB|nr:EAL domain-containing protein [Lachnoclostridium sp. Marseille-P6806]
MIFLFAAIDVLVMLALFADRFMRRKLPVRRSRVFNILMYSHVLTMTANLLSAHMNAGHRQHSVALLVFLNTLYILCIVFRAYFFYYYSILLFGLTARTERIFERAGQLLLVLPIFVTLADMWRTRVFYFDPLGYRRGSLMYLIFSQTILYVLICIVLLWKQRKRFTVFQIYFAALYLLTLFVGTLVRAMMERNVGMGMFGNLAIAFVFIAFENPDIYQQGNTEMFNEDALEEALEERLPRGAYCFFAFKISLYYENIEICGKAQVDAAVMEVGRFLQDRYPDVSMFYAEGRFCLLGGADFDAGKTVTELKERFRRPWRFGNWEFYLTPVFAVTDDRCGITSHLELIQSMKSILLRRERAGCRGFMVTPEELAEVKRDWHVKQLLAGAARQNIVEMFLQPIVDARTRKLAGAEALMRLRDTDGSCVLPDQFISLAEQNGAIESLGKQIFDRACAFFAEHSERLGLQWINVNLSPVQCLNPTVPGEFRAIAGRYGVQPGRIHLEITEESCIDRQRLLRFMKQMEEAGFIFALDDYGSGYSNACRIKELPFRNIKLDKELVWDHFRQPDAILEMTISAFRSLSYTVTAEGVETREAADELERLGVDFLQGFLFSRPLPVEEFLSACESLHAHTCCRR